MEYSYRVPSNSEILQQIQKEIDSRNQTNYFLDFYPSRKQKIEEQIGRSLTPALKFSKEIETAKIKRNEQLQFLFEEIVILLA
jgi:hypothetical protein